MEGYRLYFTGALLDFLQRIVDYYLPGRGRRITDSDARDWYILYHDDAWFADIYLDGRQYSLVSLYGDSAKNKQDILADVKAVLGAAAKGYNPLRGENGYVFRLTKTELDNIQLPTDSIFWRGIDERIEYPPVFSSSIVMLEYGID